MMKKMMLVLGLVFGLGLLAAIPAQAEIPSDSFTITISPVGDRGVIISTTDIAVSLTLGATQYTNGAEGVVVTSTGSIGPVEYTLQAAIAGAWTLSTDGYADATDELALHAIFRAPPYQGTQVIADFEEGNILKNLVVDTGAQQVGDGPGKYENAQDMDDLGLDVNRNLWFQLKAPPDSSTSANQTVTVTVTAEVND